MFVNEVNDVKIYNLSAGKSVPDVSNVKIYLSIGLIAFFFCSGSPTGASGLS